MVWDWVRGENPSVPKSSEYLLSRCLDLLKAFWGGICGSKQLQYSQGIWKTRVRGSQESKAPTQGISLPPIELVSYIDRKNPKNGESASGGLTRQVGISGAFLQNAGNKHRKPEGTLEKIRYHTPLEKIKPLRIP